MISHFKKKPIRLKGKKLHKLYQEVYERDQGLCQVLKLENGIYKKCGKWVEPGTPPHHVVPRSQGGSDTAENLITICNECHYRKHHGGKK